MRMWNVNPRIMCRQHLLGEHLEMHMFMGYIKRGKSIQGYIQKGLVEVWQIRSRHDELVEEMKRRGYCHSSPMNEDLSNCIEGDIDVEKSLSELLDRCEECRFRMIRDLSLSNY